ncbi:MAG: tRNA pseudouridine(55) synthase TruB [Eggerthellaceae bacterium]|nr:tRNA pseudouridine(55) synthase TruB [Eggerthellaceae bacterium]
MKRGQSGLSLLVAVNKPSGMSSHDVVNTCRRIFEEKRVGHTGTLDPLTTGLLPICIGPATKLDRFLTGHDKRYIARIGFGYETTTDDLAGSVTVRGELQPHLLDGRYAQTFVENLRGSHEQLPPQYSAIKVNGQRAYDAARKGDHVDLEFRTIQIHEARLLGVQEDEESGLLCWDVEFFVSKGTYIRSLARDIGRIVGTPAHLRSLCRISAGNIDLEDAVTLDTLQNLKASAALDPVAALGFRYAFADAYERFVVSGNALREDQVSLMSPISLKGGFGSCSCMGGNVIESDEAPAGGEIASIVVGNRLKALYRYVLPDRRWKAECVFQTGIVRG